jgi:hypothetical protein
MPKHIRLISVCAGLAAALSFDALAAPLTEADAARIGKEANVQGLRALVAQRDQALLFRATQSWSFGSARDLPAPLEALIVEHYADRTAQRPLLSLVARSLDRMERYPKYRSRALFDLLYADMKANTNQDRFHYSIRIIATDLSVEPELTALLPLVDVASANEIVMFLGARKYAPALPALQALQARVPLERNTNQMLERVDWAFLQIGTREATQALLARLRTLGASRDERAASEVWNILLNVSQQPPGSPPDYAELRAALPAELNDNGWDMLIRLIVARKEKRGIPELQRAIAQSGKIDQALDALLAIGEPPDWRAGRERLAQAAGRLPAERIAALQKRLDDALADPAQFAALRAQREQAVERQRGEDAYMADRNRIAPLRRTEPKRYAGELAALLQRREAMVRGVDGPQGIGARANLARDYGDLGALLRFEQHQPDQAIAAYESSRRLQAQDALDVAALCIADIRRFDKRDPKRAVEEYRRALAGAALAAGQQRQDARFATAMKIWLEHEIAYLERGQRFSGALDLTGVEWAFLWLALASSQAPFDAPLDARALSKLQPSQFQIGRTLPSFLELPPDEMLSFLARHDPAGYLTAATLTYALYKEPSPFVKSAAESFFKSRGIRVPLPPSNLERGR